MTKTNKAALKARNTKKEATALLGTKSEIHKKWKLIAQELSDRNISLADIANPDSRKQLGLAQLADETKMSMGDLVLLGQYAEAIENHSTKAAEFIRDTMGEKPSTTVDLNETQSTGLSQMSLEDLLALKTLLEKQSKEK